MAADGRADAVRALVVPGATCIVSTVRPDGAISSVPVSPMFDGERLWFSARSDTRKVRNLQRDNRVTVVLCDSANAQHYVQVRGRAHVEPDPDRRRIDEVARFHMGVAVYPYDKPGQERVAIEIEADVVVVPSVHGAKR
jgi:PPOX class probable F420-dependent enzyme